MQGVDLTFSHNKDAFGSDIVLNNNITVSRGALINNSNVYNAPSLSDNPNNKNEFAIVASSKAGACKKEIPTTKRKVFEVKMAVANNGCGNPTDLEIVDDLVSPDVSYTKSECV